MAFSIDASDPLTVFGALAMLIFLGFAGNLIFSKLRFNDTLILILVGVIVGPVMGLIEQEPMLALSGIVGPLALILILFDGGLALKFRELATGLGSAAVLGLVSFVATVGIIGGLTAILLDISFTTGLVLGAILGGTSALVVLPSLEHMKVSPKTGTTLSLESALTDVLVVVVSFTLIAIVAAGTVEPGELQENATGIDFDAQGITSKLLITFSMSIFLGLAAGFAWLLIYPNLREKPFGYMLTLGFMFAMYVFVEWILQDVSSGGGPLAVLAFGIILGNAQSLGNLGSRVGADFGATMKRFQGEISFLVRTFFFVFLGIIVDLDLLKDIKILGISVLLLAGMVGARYIAVSVMTRRVRLRGDDLVLMVMMPRGLAAAVLAAEPAAQGIMGTESFVALAFLNLVGTNLLSTVGGIYLEKRGAPGAPGRGVAGRDSATKRKSPAKSTTPIKSSKGPAKKGKGAKQAGKSGSAKKTSTAKSSKRRSTTQSALEDLGRQG